METAISMLLYPISKRLTHFFYFLIGSDDFN